MEVTWRDATSIHGWDEVEAWKKDVFLIECRTVGYLIRRDKKLMAVAQTVTERGKASEVWCVPTPWVTKVKVLRK